jgi:hypothetical protein
VAFLELLFDFLVGESILPLVSMSGLSLSLLLSAISSREDSSLAHRICSRLISSLILVTCLSSSFAAAIS